MKFKPFLLMMLCTLITQLYAMKSSDHINADTLVLKGRIVKADMETQKGTKSEGVQDYYFSSGSNSYFIKTAVGDFSKEDLDKLGFEKELTIKCVKKFGNTDIGPQDASYAATRVGEYIVILEVLP